MNVDIFETTKAAWSVIGPIAGGTGIWAYLRSRTPKRSSPSQIAESQADLVIAVNDQTKTILAENARLRRESNQERRRLTRAVERISAEVAECNGRHEDCEVRVMGLTGEVATYRAQVEELMQRHKPAAAYDKIKRVGPKDL